MENQPDGAATSGTTTHGTTSHGTTTHGTTSHGTTTHGTKSDATIEALLDATERLLVTAGPSALTTRRIAEEAGQTHGLIRYHFGSVEALMEAALRRATERILDRQRALYAGDRPFIDKWRIAMANLEADLADDPFPKLAAEVLALGWNEPRHRRALHAMLEDFTDMLSDAVRAALDDYDLDDVSGALDVEAIATLIRTFQLGMLAERLAGVELGHTRLLQAIDAWLVGLPRRV